MDNFVVAIDGPAGSGKSSVSKEIASRLGFTHIDTGEELRVIVTNLYKYDTFEELFSHFDHKRFGSKENDDSSCMDVFYTKEEQEKYGALGIEINLL